MKPLLLCRLLLFLSFAGSVIADDLEQRMLVVTPPESWSVDFNGGENLQGYVITKKSGGDGLLMFNKSPITMGKVDYINKVEKISKVITANPGAFKLLSDKHLVEHFASSDMVGRFMKLESEGGLCFVVLVFGDDNTTWMGQFTGQTEQWEKALWILKHLKTKRKVEDSK